jgi:hypothetical protein
MPTKVSKAATQTRDLQADILQFAQLESPVQEAARLLYNSGFNVFPLLAARKQPGYAWRSKAKLHLTRLHPDFLHLVFAGRCNLAVLTGETSGNLFVLDCDTPTAFEYHVREAKKRSIPLWVVETARGGHLYFRTREGTVKNLSLRVSNMDVRGHGIYVLAPPSVHPTGTIYDWRLREGDEPPLVSIQDIDWLRDTAGVPVQLELQTVSRSAKKGSQQTRENRLSRSTQDYLERGHTYPEGQRHNALRKAAWNMAHEDFTQDEVYARLEPIARASGLTNAEISSLIDGAFAKAHTPDAKTTAHHFDWERAQDYASNHQWTGRTGPTDRAVFLALVERSRMGAYEDGTFRATLRELAEHARCGVNTVQRSLHRMKSLISAAGVDKASGGSLRRFTDEVLVASAGYKMDTLSKAQKPISSSVSKMYRSDVSERGALGKTGIVVYATMLALPMPVSTKAIAETALLTKRQVKHALGPKSWLRMSGLVESTKGGWIAFAADSTQLDERISRPAGTQGKGEKRRQKHVMERALNASLYIIQWRKAKDKNYFEPMVTIKGIEVPSHEQEFIIEKSA